MKTTRIQKMHKQHYALTAALLMLSVGLVFISILENSYKLLGTFVLIVIVSGVVLNAKKVIQPVKSGLGAYRKRLFFYTTREVKIGIILTLLALFIPLSYVTIAFYVIVGCIFVMAIISSVWLLFTKETLAKKLIVVLYILVIPILVAGATYVIALSNLSF